ncbi:MAG: hypothetical protein LW698_08090 [Planctomycetaceae bacterium]|nr:hypothetical protein [Planctomycetaceae bacterium]
MSAAICSVSVWYSRFVLQALSLPSRSRFFASADLSCSCFWSAVMRAFFTSSWAAAFFASAASSCLVRLAT